MNMTQEPLASKAPNGEEGRSQDLKIDLKLLSVLNYICGSMYKQWAVVKQLLETGDAKGVNLDSVGDSILYVETEIVELESLVGRR